MSFRLQIAVRSWLRHELAGRDERAERALARAFARLPRATPSAAFAERVLRRAGFDARRGARDLRSPRARVLVATWGLLTAIALLFLPSVAEVVRVGLGSGTLLELGAQTLAGGIERLAHGLALWETLSQIARTVAGAAASPQVLALMAVSALVSVTALRLLQGLLISDRSAYYVES